MGSGLCNRWTQIKAYGISAMAGFNCMDFFHWYDLG